MTIEGRAVLLLHLLLLLLLLFIWCFKEVVGMCKTCYGMFRGRIEGREREGSKWTGVRNQCEKIEGKGDKRGWSG